MVLFLLLPVGAGAKDRPNSSKPATFVVKGMALRTALPQVAAHYQVPLRASRTLEPQRVTLIARDLDLTTMAEALEALLSPNDEAPVFWARRDGRWSLEESVQRQELRGRLPATDVEQYREFLKERLQWLRAEGLPKLKETPRDSPIYGAMNDRCTPLMLLENVGERGREALLHGAPLISKIGDLPAPLSERWRELLTLHQPRLAGLAPEQLDQYSIVLLLSRNPTDPKGARLMFSMVTPTGFNGFRFSLLSMPGALRPASIGAPFNLPRADPEDPSPRVTMKLNPAVEGKQSRRTERSLDDLLEELSRQAGVSVVADGYLRARMQFPVGLQVEDYPLLQLAQSIGRVWGCDVKWLAAQRTLLVRARAWWLEDQADVPDEVIRGFGAALGAGQSPKLADLLRLAELSNAQVYKLVESGVCPAAAGLVLPGFYDEANSKPLLQFFNRLPEALQKRSQSPEGLLLRDVPSALVEQWLFAPLAAHGATTPALLTELRFYLREVPGRKPDSTAVEVGVVGSRAGGTHWLQRIESF